MDIKITKARFSNLIAYDLVKVIASIFVAIMVWVLLFTTCATRATVGEQFAFVTFGNIYSREDFAVNMVSELKKSGKLSYDVLKADVMDVTEAGDYSALYMLSLKSSTKEGDVILFNGNIVSEKNEDGTVKVDENGQKILKINDDAQAVVNNSYLQPIDDYLNSAKNYLDKFLTNGQIDEGKIERYFLDIRLKESANYRRTYRTSEQKADGIQKEIERIKTLNENYTSVINAIETAKNSGVDLFWYADFNKGESYEKLNIPYGIDLYKLNELYAKNGGTKLSEYWWYWLYSETDTEAAPTRSSEGLVLSVFNYSNAQPDLHYESLAVMDKIIRTFSDYAK